MLADRGRDGNEVRNSLFSIQSLMMMLMMDNIYLLPLDLLSQLTAWSQDKDAEQKFNDNGGLQTQASHVLQDLHHEQKYIEIPVTVGMSYGPAF
jgi:hypothetical protein